MSGSLLLNKGENHHTTFQQWRCHYISALLTTKKAFHENILNIFNIFCMNKLAAVLVHDTKWHHHSKKAWRRFRSFEIKLIGKIECCDLLDNIQVCQDKTNQKIHHQKIQSEQSKTDFPGRWSHPGTDDCGIFILWDTQNSAHPKAEPQGWNRCFQHILSHLNIYFFLCKLYLGWDQIDSKSFCGLEMGCE